jgi:hypothetical protein
MELLKARAKLFIVHIPYNGAPPAVQAAAAGDVQAVMSNPTSLAPLIAAGRLRPLATTGRTRSAPMQELPAIAESGIDGLRDFEAIAWNGFIAPAGTPREIVERLNREINAILQTPETRARIEAAGWNCEGGSGKPSPTSCKPSATAGGRSSNAPARSSIERFARRAPPPARPREAPARAPRERSASIECPWQA